MSLNKTEGGPPLEKGDAPSSIPCAHRNLNELDDLILLPANCLITAAFSRVFQALVVMARRRREGAAPRKGGRPLAAAQAAAARAANAPAPAASSEAAAGGERNDLGKTNPAGPPWAPRAKASAWEARDRAAIVSRARARARSEAGAKGSGPGRSRSRCSSPLLPFARARGARPAVPVERLAWDPKAGWPG